MAIKFLAGERMQGTAAEREATIVESKSQDYAGILSTYSPEFMLKFDEGTGTPDNDGTAGDQNVVMGVSNSNPAWVAGYDTGGYAIRFDGTLSNSGWNNNSPKISWDTLDAGNNQNWTIMMLIKWHSSIPNDFVAGTFNDPYNYSLSTGNFMIPDGARRFGVGVYLGSNAPNYPTYTWDRSNNSTDLTPDVWTVIGVSHASNGAVTHYLNGVADGSETMSTSGGDDLDGLKIHESSGVKDYDSFLYWDAVESAATHAAVAAKLRTSTFTYPNFPNGTIFEESDSGEHYMWNGSNAWNKVT